MAVNLSMFAGAGAQFFDNNGVILSGGLIYTYAAGTTAPQATYTTSTGSAAHTNPIMLDSAGRVPSGEIWLTTGATYKFILKTSLGVQIGSYDNISSVNDFAAVYTAFANTTDVTLGDALVGFRQSKSSGILPNAVGRTVHQKLQELISVKDFGAVGDGVTDDTVAIQAAINAIATFDVGGGIVFFPIGVYKTTSTIQINYPVTLQGSDGGSIIAPNFVTTDTLVLNSTLNTGRDSGVSIFNLTFKASVTRTGGYYVNINGASYTTVRDCNFVNGYNGLGITGDSCASNKIYTSIFANLTNVAIGITAVTTGQGSVDTVLEDLSIHGNGPSNQTAIGIFVTVAGDITLRHVSTVWCASGVSIAPSSGNRIQTMNITESYFDSGTNYGIYASGGQVDLLSISNTWCSTNGSGGIYLNGISGRQVNQVDIVNVVCSNNSIAGGGAGNGLYIDTYCTNVTVIGGSFSNNISNGIYVAANVSNFKIIGATCGASGEFPGNIQYGIYVDSGASNNYQISNNRLLSNSIGQLYDGGTGVNKIVYPNVGAGTAITTNATPSIDWGLDFAKQGYFVIANGTPYSLAVGSGLILLTNDGTGATGMFLASGGTVTKVSGDATIVSGAAGANQIGLSFSGGLYKVSNGYTPSQNIYICTIKTRLTS
jgi:hypothetical protein